MVLEPTPQTGILQESYQKNRPELTLHDLWAGYGKKEVLRGVNLSLDRGEIVALLGPNGAGKSTILKVIMGLLPLYRGSVNLEGLELSTLKPYERVAKGVAYLIQGGEIFSSLTVKENIAISVVNLPPRDREKAMDDVVKMFPILRRHWHRRAGVFSGGQRRTLALGMVLVKKPKVLLLDEPTAGLAPNVAQNLLTQVGELNELLEITILLVEQRVREALQVSHRGIMLVNGTIAAKTSAPMSWLSEGALDAYFFTTSLRAEQFDMEKGK